jgi:hypothetical protein
MDQAAMLFAILIGQVAGVRLTAMNTRIQQEAGRSGCRTAAALLLTAPAPRGLLGLGDDDPGRRHEAKRRIGHRNTLSDVAEDEVHPGAIPFEHDDTADFIQPGRYLREDVLKPLLAAIREEP